MKIIDILNTIARGETPPKKIMYDRKIWEYREYDGEASDGTIWTSIEYRNIENGDELFDEYVITGILNDEVEILETTITWKQDKKIEKLELDEYGNFKRKDGRIHIISPTAKAIIDKLNEIIEVLNER